MSLVKISKPKPSRSLKNHVGPLEDQNGPSVRKFLQDFAEPNLLSLTSDYLTILTSLRVAFTPNKDIDIKHPLVYP